MRTMRLAVVLFFLLSCVCFAAYYGMEWKNADRNVPEIQIENDKVEVYVSATEEDLLEGVTAWDEEDGDLTDRLQVVSLSPFVGQKERTVNYIVFDSAGKPATASRTVLYRNYESPRIYIKAPLRFEVGELVEGLETLDYEAVDVLDGDLTNKVRISYTTAYGIVAGDYNFTLQVSNSAGDTCILPVKMTILDPNEELGKYYPVLSDYVVYVKAGRDLDEKDLLTGVAGNGRTYMFDEVVEGNEDFDVVSRRDIEINSNVNYDVPGVYTVEYSYTTEDDVTAVTVLYVVVEE